MRRAFMLRVSMAILTSVALLIGGSNRAEAQDRRAKLLRNRGIAFFYAAQRREHAAAAV